MIVGRVAESSKKTTIAISKELRDKLNILKRPMDAYEHVIRRALVVLEEKEREIKKR